MCVNKEGYGHTAVPTSLPTCPKCTVIDLSSEVLSGPSLLTARVEEGNSSSITAEPAEEKPFSACSCRREDVTYEKGEEGMRGGGVVLKPWGVAP